MLKQIIASVGSVVTGACCLGFAPFIAGLSAIGAGFLVNDAILIPLFAVFLALHGWALFTSRKRHGRSGPFYLGVGGGIVAFMALWFFAPLAYAALAALLAAAAWDIVALRQRSQTLQVPTIR